MDESDAANGAPGVRTGSPSVTILVPTKNRRAKISALLDRVLADPDQHEVVVVDDGSDDGTPDVLAAYAERDPRVVPILTGGTGRTSRARLRGARAATGDLLVMLDDDVMPMPGLATAHADRHVGQDTSLVLGYMPTLVPDPLPPGGFATVLYAQEYETRCEEYEAEPSLVMTGLWLGNASLRREHYIEAFDSGLMPEFPHRHEDRILGLALRDLGVTGRFDWTLYAQHVHHRPLDAFLSDCYQQGQGREEIHRLYPEVLAESSESAYLSGLPGPVHALVAATRHEPVRRVVTGGLRAGIRCATAIHAPRMEITMARVVRRVEQMHGARNV